MGGRFPTGNQISYNVGVGGKWGMTLGGSGATVTNYVYNNVFYGFTINGLNIDNSPSIGSVKNNIFWSSVLGPEAIRDSGGSASMTSDYNIFGPEPTSYLY